MPLGGWGHPRPLGRRYFTQRPRRGHRVSQIIIFNSNNNAQEKRTFHIG